MGCEVLGAGAGSSRNNCLLGLAVVGTSGRGLRPRDVLGRGGEGELSLSELITITSNRFVVKVVLATGWVCEGGAGFSDVVSSVSDMSEEGDWSVTILRTGRPVVGPFPTFWVRAVAVGLVGDDSRVVRGDASTIFRGEREWMSVGTWMILDGLPSWGDAYRTCGLQKGGNRSSLSRNRDQFTLELGAAVGETGDSLVTFDMILEGVGGVFSEEDVVTCGLIGAGLNRVRTDVR